LAIYFLQTGMGRCSVILLRDQDTIKVYFLQKDFFARQRSPLMFEIRKCTQPACGLRLSINPVHHRGAFCPRCGAPLSRVGEPYQTPQGGVRGRPIRRVRVLLDNIRSAYNTGAIFRTADGVGIEHLYLCGITPTPHDNTALQKTALGAESLLPWSAHPDANALGQDLRDAGFKIIALETAPQAVSIFEVDPQSIGTGAVLLVVGNEQAGIDPELLDLSDLVLALPMVGSKASLNAAVAFGVAAYWLSFA
jgi:23S rRNA (guanosine2251-2'-O)-methyltransferase